MAASKTLKDSLFTLIMEKNYKDLELFVKKNTIVDSTFADYEAVVYACSIWDPKALDILLAGGARLHDERNSGKFNDTPMYQALLFNDTGMAHALLLHGFSFRKLNISVNSPAEALLWTTKTSPAMVDLVLNTYIKERYNPPDRYNLAPSHIACMHGKSGVFEKFLEFDDSAVSLPIKKECDVNLGGASALHLAVMYRRYEHVKLLLKRGAYPLALDASSRTPLHCAAYREDKDMIKLLFEYLNVKTMRANPRDSSGITLFHVACWLGPAEVVEDLIRGKQYDVNSAIDVLTYDHRNQTFFGYTPLHFAIEGGNAATVRLLLANGAQLSAMSGIEDHKKATPLTLAVKLQFKEAVDALTELLYLQDLHSVTHDIGFANLYSEMFEGNSSTNLPDPGDWKRCTPLHYAVARRDVDLVEALLKAGADVNKPDDRRLTPLMLACILTTRMTQQMKGVAFKMGNGDLIRKMTKWFDREDSPQLRIINLLLEYNADVNVVDRNGTSALAFLTMNSLFNWVEIDVTEDTKNTLFEYSYHLICELLRRGASVLTRCMGGVTLIHNLCKVGNVSDLFVTNEKARIRLLQLYADAGCDVNARTIRGKTCLYIALNYDLFHLAEQLIKRGADVYAKTDYGETVLHAMAGSFATKTRECFMAYLLSMGVDINARMSEHSTVLHLAVRLSLNNNNALVALLLEHGADVNARDSRKATPLHYAIASDNKVMANMLANFGANMDYLNQVGETPLSLAGRMVSNINKRKAAVSIAKFIYRMRAIGKRYAYENVRVVEKLAAMRSGEAGFRQGPINDEIDRLKSRVIVPGSKNTMYSLLSRSVYEMRHYARNEKFVKLVQSSAFIDEFPLFGPLIVARTRRALVRERALDPARMAISVIMRLEIPGIADNILNHFSDFELYSFVQISLADPEIHAEMDRRKQSSLSIELNLLDGDSDNECTHS